MTVERNAKDIARLIPKYAPVAVTMVDDERAKPEYRGYIIYGFWLGIVPNPNVPDAIRNDLEGNHWLAEIVDADSDQLLWEPTLSSIAEINIAPDQVQQERER